MKKIQNDYGSTVLEVDELESDDSLLDLIKETYWKDKDFVKGIIFNSFFPVLF